MKIYASGSVGIGITSSDADLHIYGSSTIDKIQDGNIFIYGQKVNNFCTLKKESIWTVATAALQEVDRQLQAEKAKTADLETEVTTLKSQVAALLAKYPID